MTEPDPVLDALLAALASNDHPDLHLAVARHLLQRSRPDEALDHLRTVLAVRPADVEVLTVAAEAAEGAGRDAVASGYRQLLAALGGAPGTTPSQPPPSQPPPTPLTPSSPPPPPATEPPPPPATEPPPPPSEPSAGSALPFHPGNPSPEMPQEARPATALPAGPGGVDGDTDEFDDFLREVLAEDQGQRVRLSDVGGMSQVKAELERRFFLPIRHPEIQRAFGKPVNGGLLLYGPPGCGKTYLARAIAGELAAAFLPVTLHDTLDMWMGNSEQNLHAIFSAARADTPAVLFLDEVDAIGQKRSRSASSGMRNVVAQLLSELDGAVERNDGVFVIAATNAPWDVDPALRRPGRLDRTVLVLPPDAEAREAILATHLRHRPTTGLDLRKVAERTRDLTGADLKLICDTATELAMERAVRSGKVEPIDQKLLDKAAKTVKPSVGPWLDTARNFVTFANDSGEYDDLERYLASQRR